MRFSIETATLFDAASAAARATAGATKTTIPILSHVLVAAQDGQVEVAGTDLDRRVAASFEAGVDEPGTAVLPADRLAGLLKGLPGDAVVTIKSDGAGAALQCGRSRYKLPGLPPDDFPAPLEISDGAATFTFAADDVDALRAVAVAQSDEKTRFYLNGTCLHAADGKLVMVATDGHVLITARTDIPHPTGSIIIPRETVAAVLKMAGNGDLALRTDGRRMEAAAGRVRLISKLVDGTYPEYAHAVPQLGPHNVVVDHAEFISALKRAEIIVTDKRFGTNVTVAWGDAAELRVTVPRCEAGEGEDVIVAETSGAGNVSFYVHKMLTVLDALDADTVCLGHESGGRGILVTVPARPSVRAVVMPCRPPVRPDGERP
jgi:DNA polymerase III subunit beta